MTRKELIHHFPRLRASSFGLTSPPTINYNCIAWAVADQSKRWWPNQRGYYWPSGLPKSDDLSSFVAMFATHGYAPCADGKPENAVEKVAVFASPDGHVKHAARQLANGRWTSKLGPADDISHELLALEGTQYGFVVQFLARLR